MALHVWLVEGSKLILNVEQILKVPILATIYNDWHNDRELMYKIFKFIDCYADEDGYIHRNGLKDQKAFDYAIEVAQLIMLDRCSLKLLMLFKLVKILWLL